MAFFQNAINKVANAFADLLGVVPVGEYNATPPIVADGDAVNLQVDAAGNLKVASAGTATLPTGASTEAKQDTGNASLASIDGKVATAAKQDTQTTALGNILTAIQLNATESSLASLLSEVRELATEAALATLGSEIKFRQEAGNTHLNDIKGKLPATLGSKITAESLAVTLPTDLQPFKIEAPGPQMTTLRTLSGATADTEPPTDGSTWVAMPGASYAGLLEIPIAGAFTAVGGTVAPTLVTMRVWSRLGSGGAISKVYEETFQAAWLTTGIATNPYRPRYIPFNAPDALVTFTFPDGTAPTITGTVKGRMVAVGPLTSKDFPRDPATGNVIFQSASYDSATQTDKVSDAYKECDLYLTEPAILNSTGLAHTTPITYYPSSDGAVMDGYDSVSFQYSLAAGGGGTIETWWEVANADVWTLATDCTLAGSNLNIGARPTATPLSSATTLTGFVQFDNLNAKRIRQCVLPKTANSGAVVINMRRKVRGS